MLSLKKMLGLCATAALSVGLGLGADRAEATTVTISVTAFGAGGIADIEGALAAQSLFHGAGPMFAEDFEGFATGPSGAALNTAVGTFSPLSPAGTGTADLAPSNEAQIRDGSGKSAGRYNTTTGGANYLDSNDNSGIRLDTTGVGSFTRLSLLATDIDDVGTAKFGIDVDGLTQMLAGNLGPFSNGTLHLFTFLFSDPVSNIGINFMIDPGDGFGVDNFAISTVSPVPLPATGWLLLSSLAGLGFLCRRRRSVS